MSRKLSGVATGVIALLLFSTGCNSQSISEVSSVSTEGSVISQQVTDGLTFAAADPDDLAPDSASKLTLSKTGGSADGSEADLGDHLGADQLSADQLGTNESKILGRWLQIPGIVWTFEFDGQARVGSRIAPDEGPYQPFTWEVNDSTITLTHDYFDIVQEFTWVVIDDTLTLSNTGEINTAMRVPE